MFKNLLLATDGSTYAVNAATKAIEIATLNREATIDIVYVVDHAKAKSDVLEHWNAIDAWQGRQKKVTATEKLMEKAGVRYRTHFLHGTPGPTLVKHANEGNYDLMIVGSRGKNKLQQLVLGSVSHKVAKRVNCPVMIIKGKYVSNIKNVSANKGVVTINALRDRSS
ncbi:universal stress protein [Desertibacillus haloalkaliphilus]|nr:universal stress protein [Desertibacillus haloalkaliphilus]MBU8908685.1 universal stress protein [Desertibacillus haloalkaliphilus]